MTNAIPPPPLDGTNREPRDREADRFDHPERFIREARRHNRRHHADRDAPKAEPTIRRPNGESDRGLDGFK